MEPTEEWLRVDPLCFGIQNRYLSHLPLAVVNCQNIADIRNVKQTEANLPGISLEASVPVACCWCDGQRRNGQLPGYYKQAMVQQWSALVFALGCSNEVKLGLRRVLILGVLGLLLARPTGREWWHKFPVHTPMTTVSVLAIRWTLPVSFPTKLEERLKCYLYLKPEWSLTLKGPHLSVTHSH